MANTTLKNYAANAVVPGSSGGPAYRIDDMQRARRFLVMGSEASFYESGAELTAGNAEAIARLAKSSRADELVDLIVGISTAGRAARQSYGLFALALVQANAEGEAKTAAYRAVSEVCRTFSALAEWMGYHEQLRGTRGPAYVKAIRRWIESRPGEALAYQAVKYRQREGWTLGDAARIAHPKTDRAQGAVLEWAIRGTADEAPAIIRSFERAKAEEDPRRLAEIVREDGLTWEMVPTGMVNEREVLEALAERMPMHATLRNLTRFAKAGLLDAGTRTLELVASRLRDAMNSEPELDPLELFDHVYTVQTPQLAAQRAQLAEELSRTETQEA